MSKGHTLVVAALLAQLALTTEGRAAETVSPAPNQASNVSPTTLPVKDIDLPPRIPDPAHWDRISSPKFWAAQVPKNAPVTPARVKLGDKLFHDKRLSVNDAVACQTCHADARGFTDGRPRALGIAIGQRNAPPAMDALFMPFQFWDGRAKTLEDQAKLPILNPIEMGVKSPEDAVAKVKAHANEYGPLFQSAFGSSEVTFDRMAEAIATYERTLLSRPAPFDRFLAGDVNAISPAAKRGWDVFNGQGRCISCHGADPSAPLFTDFKFHNIGIAAHSTDFVKVAREAAKVVNSGNQQQIDRLAIASPKFSELGRFLVTKSPGDIGAFKTPNLRNIVITGPYMHDGSLDTLWDVMDHYNKGGVPNPFLDGGIVRLNLTEDQINDVIAFLSTLTSPEYAPLAEKELARQRAYAKTHRPQRDLAAVEGKKGDHSDPNQPAQAVNAADLGGRSAPVLPPPGPQKKRKS